jgi:serine/threonine-protein kinase
MGMVYEADDQLLRTRVAVKLLVPEVASAPQLLEQLHREILVGRRIGHPNVCRLYDLGKSGDLHFISMEFVEGETLESCLRRGPLPPDRAIEILEQICAALAAAHAEGVVHRDLKPANVMLDEDGRVKVMDFGLARDTPAYWSPEQARGEPATVASDLCALGRTALQLFGGLHTARGKRELASVPEPYRKAIARCLELAAEDRWPSAEALRLELSRGAPAWLPRVLAGLVLVGALGGGGALLATHRAPAPTPVPPLVMPASAVRAARSVGDVEARYAAALASSRNRFLAIGTLGRIEQRLRLAERALRDGDAPGADERLVEIDRIFAEEP